MVLIKRVTGCKRFWLSALRVKTVWICKIVFLGFKRFGLDWGIITSFRSIRSVWVETDRVAAERVCYRVSDPNGVKILWSIWVEYNLIWSWVTTRGLITIWVLNDQTNPTGPTIKVKNWHLSAHITGW